MKQAFTIKILAAYPNTPDYDCTEETLSPAGGSTMVHPGNLPARAGQLLQDGWEPIGAGYVYLPPDMRARTQLAFRKIVPPPRQLP